jgi:hypothetical protein
MKLYNIDHFEFALLTHFHNDHYGNFERLIKENKIKKLYMPDPEKQNFSGQYSMKIDILRGTYNMLKEACSSVNINYEFAPNGKIDFHGAILTFYNTSDTDYDYYKNINNQDYNNFSVCLNVEYLNRALVFQGDCNYDAMEHNAFNFPSNVDLIKSNHHGVSIVPNNFRRITPKDVVVTASLDTLKSEYLKQGFENAMRELGANIYIISKQIEPIHITYTKFTTKYNDKIILDATPSTYRFKTIYVDKNYTGQIKTGDQRFPFNKLADAIRHANNLYNAEVKIKVADGDYSDISNYTDVNLRYNSLRIECLKNELNISPINSKNPNVIFPPILVQNCTKVSFNNINFISDNDANNPYQIEILNSLVVITDSILDSVNKKTKKDKKDKICFWIQDNSFVYLSNITIKNNWCGIKVANSNVVLAGTNHNNSVDHTYIPVSGSITVESPFIEKNYINQDYFNSVGRVIFKGTNDATKYNSLQPGVIILNTDKNTPEILQSVKLQSGFVQDKVFSIVDITKVTAPQYEGQFGKNLEDAYIGLNNKWIKIS